MTKSKLISAWQWIFSILLILSLIPLFSYPGDKTVYLLFILILTILASTSAYLPSQEKNALSSQYYTAYVAGYLSHIVVLVVTFLVALFELNTSGDIGIWFYILFITLALARSVTYLMLKAFSK